MSRRTLVLELWGLGDAILATALLRSLAPTGRRLAVVAKPASCRLLRPSHPEVEFLPFTAPWTAFRAKYRLWRWDHGELARLLLRLRRGRFDEALSVRPDPRDHLLMWLSGARRRLGFPRLTSGALLTDEVEPEPLRHRVGEWHARARRAAGPDLPALPPRIDAGAHAHDHAHLDVPALAPGGAPIVVLHCGAAQPVRRWPTDRWRELIEELRGERAFRLAVIPDPDGFGAALRPLADAWLPALSLDALVSVIARASLFLGNDSGPAHLASALGVPTVALFGPQRPEWFAPWGPLARAVPGAPCPHRPCRDHCRFEEPFCMTRLDPARALAAARELLRRSIDSPSRFRASRVRTSPDAAADAAKPTHESDAMHALRSQGAHRLHR